MHRNGQLRAYCCWSDSSCSWGARDRRRRSSRRSRPRPRPIVAATTPEENLAIVRSFYEEGVNGADLSVFDRVAAPDIVYHGATVGDESGLDALKRIYGEALTGFPGLQYTLLTSVADGDAVALRYQCRGRAHRRVPGTGADR